MSTASAEREPEHLKGGSYEHHRNSAAIRAAQFAQAVVGLTAMTVASMFAVPGASASEGSITCKGTEVLTYSAGVKLFPRMVTLTATANFGPCVSTNPASASGSAGTPPGGVPATLSCLNLLDSSSGQATITWNNGNTSRYAFNRSSQTVGGQLIATATGAVTAGELLGRSVSIVSVSPAPNFLDCLSPGGMTQRTGVVTLTIA